MKTVNLNFLSLGSHASDYRTAFLTGTSKETLAEKFFSEIESYGLCEIADFLSGLTQKQKSPLEKEELQKLSKRINFLLESSNEKSELSELANILNTTNIPDLDLENLSRFFNQHIEQSKPREIVRMLNGLAHLGCDRQEIPIVDFAKIVSALNQQKRNFRDPEKINLLHACAKLGFQYEEVDEDLKTLLHKTATDLSNKVSIVHSLAKLGMFEHLSQMNLSAANFSELTSESAFSLLQAHMIYDLIAEKKLFDEAQLNEIAAHYKPADAHVSRLQRVVGRYLPQSKQEESLYEIAGKSIRDTDIYYAIGDNHYFIEVDGPTHFCRDGVTQNSATKQRDLLNQKAIARTNKAEGNLYFLTLNFAEIYQATWQKKLVELLNEKVDERRAIKIEPQKIIAVEEVEISFQEMAIAQREESKPVIVTKSIFHKDSKSCINELTRELVQKNDYKKIFEDAITRKRDDVVTALLSAGADTNIILENGLTPLHYACQKKAGTIIESLITAGADLTSLEISAELINSSLKNSAIETLNAIATKAENLSAKDQIKILRKALDTDSIDLAIAVTSRADFDKNNRDLKEILDLAAKDKKVEIFNQLVVSGADVTDVKNLGDSQEFLSDILVSGNSAVAIRMLKENKECQQPLLLINAFATSAHLGDVEVLRYLIDERELSKNLKIRGANALHMAAESGRDEAVKFLLSRGLNINADDESGQSVTFNLSPLYFAICNGHTEIVRTLVDAGADVSATYDEDEFPLLKAVKMGFTDMVQILFTKKDQIPTKQKSAALLWACKLGMADIVEDLIEKWVFRVDSKDSEVLLEWATASGNLETVNVLLRNKVRLSDKAIELAHERGYDDIAQRISEEKNQRQESRDEEESDEFTTNIAKGVTAVAIGAVAAAIAYKNDCTIS